MDIVTILRVSPRRTPNGRTLYRIAASNGQTYATTNAWLASLCQRAVDQQTPVRVSSNAGWYYRTLRSVLPVEKAEATA